MDFVDDYNVFDGTLVVITESHPPDVRLNYLGKKGLLNGYCKVIVQGDPGYYFRRREQNWYPREVPREILFACSYHAYNRSDGAGAEAKRSLRRSTQRRIE